MSSYVLRFIYRQKRVVCRVTSFCQLINPPTHHLNNNLLVFVLLQKKTNKCVETSSILDSNKNHLLQILST